MKNPASDSESAKRQRAMRVRDKARGIKGLKLRCTTGESALIDNVSLAMSLKRSEACMTLFFNEAERLGIDTSQVKPAAATIRTPKNSPALTILNELSEALGLPVSTVLLNALSEYKSLCQKTS